uniref:Uncharacterized protein n=1 Tax=Chromera velia CCMP2878 TaxID=1169474 RepID=A0A0G4HTN1_9ALVE|eukprot:Cvel_31404.t1-p1 / transcript=Cvel_31404.t1 / gene=Cvel_31404 / organism=Chromera_velia_CCMP2878 / gene_product=hypothetical protein / transcript_product=hypothetical protein / location=Cvel_scaffold4675:5608-6639(-) / protein_length=305 / sequence_SO=supercontig / SO=protein_coding / is_pseudo=false
MKKLFREWKTLSRDVFTQFETAVTCLVNEVLRDLYLLLPYSPTIEMGLHTKVQVTLSLIYLLCPVTCWGTAHIFSFVNLLRIYKKYKIPHALLAEDAFEGLFLGLVRTQVSKSGWWKALYSRKLARQATEKAISTQEKGVSSDDPRLSVELCTVQIHNCLLGGGASDDGLVGSGETPKDQRGDKISLAVRLQPFEGNAVPDRVISLYFCESGKRGGVWEKREDQGGDLFPPLESLLSQKEKEDGFVTVPLWDASLWMRDGRGYAPTEPCSFMNGGESFQSSAAQASVDDVGVAQGSTGCDAPSSA